MQKRYFPIAILFALLLILLAHYSGRALAVPTSFTYAEEQKRVYLTFDDGPSDAVTVAVLDTLKAENVKATFFIVSERAKNRKEILRRTYREGHTLGVHSQTHKYDVIYASQKALLDDIAACADFIEKTAGVKPNVYRFPGGSFPHRQMRRAVENAGYRIVDWNAVCGDEEIPRADARTLVKRTVETARRKHTVILLMHDSAPHRATAEALPEIIGFFKEQGYAFCTF